MYIFPPEVIRKWLAEGDGDDRPGHGGLHGTQAAGLPPVLRSGIFREMLQEVQVLLCRSGRHLFRVAAPAKGQQVIHPVDEDGSLAASGSGQEQQRTFGCQYGVLLAGIHPFVASGDDCPPGGGVSDVKILRHNSSLFHKIVILYCTIQRRSGQR